METTAGPHYFQVDVKEKSKNHYNQVLPKDDKIKTNDRARWHVWYAALVLMFTNLTCI